MRVTPLGAAGGEVTGSAYLVETGNSRLLVDCGLFQGGRKAESLNRSPVRANARLDAVLLTHAHLDHTGRLPLITKLGYQGPIYATPATVEMSTLILKDAARIQESDAERRNRKLVRSGKPPVPPLYVPEDAEVVFGLFREVPYDKPVQILPGVQAIWVESGHMLGSASIQLLVEESGRRKRVVFSGDVGPRGALILKDYETFSQADLVFLESTYGDSDHRPFNESVEQFVEIVVDAVKRGGKMLVPTFAVGRAQLLISLLAWMFRENKVRPFPIFLDSPMAAEATQIYANHPELFDEEMTKFIAERPMREDLKSLKITISVEESKAINNQEGSCMVLAGAGMCNAGRILHHLRANLFKPETHVIMVGYQGQGSLGRLLVDGAEQVTIYNEKIAVHAQVHMLTGFSAHAGQTDLLKWFSSIAPCKPKVALTHGEDEPRKELARQIQTRFGLSCMLPAMKEGLEL